jgi:hypothetical protein
MRCPGRRTGVHIEHALKRRKRAKQPRQSSQYKQRTHDLFASHSHAIIDPAHTTKEHGESPVRAGLMVGFLAAGYLFVCLAVILIGAIIIVAIAAR